MKHLTFACLAFVLITIAGCRATRTYNPYDPNDRYALMLEQTVRIELLDGTVYYGENLHLGTDWLSFEVVSDSGWPPPGDFHSYDMGVPFESIAGLSNTSKEANARIVRVALVVFVLSAVYVGISAALAKFCEGRQSTDHPLCD